MKFLTNNQYLKALRRMRDRISKGFKLVLEESDKQGSKYSYATWGMCIEEPDFWLKEELAYPHLDPLNMGRRIDKNGKSIPILLETSKAKLGHQVCPFDRNGITGKTSSQKYKGCYHRCLVFNPDDSQPTREESLALYDEAISAFEVHFIRAPQKRQSPVGSVLSGWL